MSEHIERILVDRVVPLLLIVVIPLLAVIYVGQRQDAQARREQDIASCERGNAVRARQRRTLALLASSYTQLADHTHVEDAKITAILLADAARAKALAAEIQPVDCEVLK